MKLNSRSTKRNEEKTNLHKDNKKNTDSKNKYKTKKTNTDKIVCSFKLTPDIKNNGYSKTNEAEGYNSRSNTEIGDVRRVKKKKVKKIYLSDHDEQGGSSHLNKKGKGKIYDHDTGNKKQSNNKDCKNDTLNDGYYKKYRSNKDMKYQKTIPKSPSISSSIKKRYEILKNSSRDDIENYTKQSSNGDKLLAQNSSSNHKNKQTTNKNKLNSNNSRLNLADDEELKYFNEGVTGMFKLWNEKYNFESDDMKVNPHNKNKIKAGSITSKSRRKKFLWFRTKKKNKISKTYIAGRCQINNGLRFKIKSFNNMHQRINLNKENDEQNFSSWIEIYKTKSIQSRANVKLRWNNKSFDESKSTIIKLFDAIYNNHDFRSSQSEILTDSTIHKPSYLRSNLINNNKNIETWILEKTILDNSITKNCVPKTYSYNNINCLTKKEFIENSKAFSKRIDSIFRTDNLRLKNEKSSSRYVKMHVPKSFLLEHSNNSFRIISDEAVNKIIDYDTDETINDKTEEIDMGHLLNRNAITIGNSLYIEIKDHLVKVVPIESNHTYKLKKPAELRRIENRNKLVESYIQDYLRNSLDVNSYTQSVSDTSVNNEITSWSSDDNELLYSYSSCNVFHSEGKNKPEHTNLFQKFKYWTVSRTHEAKESKDAGFTRTWPKDSIEVHKRRKIYAISKLAGSIYCASSNDNIEKNETTSKSPCLKKSNTKKKSITFNQPLPEKELSGVYRQSSMKSVKCLSSTSCNKSSDKLLQNGCPSAQKSILKFNSRKSLSKCENLSKETSSKGLHEELPLKTSSCNPKEIIIIKDNSQKDNKKCDAVTSTKICKKLSKTCHTSQSPIGSGECLPQYAGPLNSNISDKECVAKLLKSFNPDTPTSPPKCPLVSLSDETGKVPNIEIIRRKSLCPTPKCSKHFCKKSNCKLYEGPSKPLQSNIECKKNIKCNSQKKFKDLSKNNSKENKKSDCNLQKLPNSRSKCNVELSKSKDCSSKQEIEKKSSNCSPEWCKVNPAPSEGIKPETQRQVRKEYCHKEFTSNESIVKSKVKSKCSICCNKGKNITDKSQHVCKGTCINPINMLNTTSCCTNCLNGQIKPVKSFSQTGFKLQIVPSKQKCNNNNAFILNSMNIENEGTCKQQEPKDINSLEIKTSILDDPNITTLKERELSVLNDVFTSQAKMNNCKTNLSKIVSSTQDYDSKSSVSDLVEIKFKLKIKKCDRNTDIKVENHNAKDKNKHVHTNENSKLDKKDVYLMQSMKSSTKLEESNTSAIKKDVNITITLNNNTMERTKQYKDHNLSQTPAETVKKSITATSCSQSQKTGKESTFKTSFTDQTNFTEDRTSIGNSSEISEKSESVSQINSSESTSTSGTSKQPTMSNKTSNTNHKEDFIAETATCSSYNNSVSKNKIDIRHIQNKNNLDSDASVQTEDRNQLEKRYKKDKLKELMEFATTLEHNEANVKLVADALKPILATACSCDSSKAGYREYQNTKNACCCNQNSIESKSIDRNKIGTCLCNILKNQHFESLGQVGCCCANKSLDDSSIDIGVIRPLNKPGISQNYRLYNEVNRVDTKHVKKEIISSNVNKAEQAREFKEEKEKNREWVKTENSSNNDEVKQSKLLKKQNKYVDRQDDILQSKAIKKAVLSIYAEQSSSNNNLTINLPKWIGNNRLLSNLFGKIKLSSSSESL